MARWRSPVPDIVPSCEIDEELIAGTPKPKRRRLAKAELLMVLACAAEHFADYSTHTERIGAVYGLSEADVDTELRQIADELERRAMRAGFEEAWVL